jgi:uncharacterized protein DUF402
MAAPDTPGTMERAVSWAPGEQVRFRYMRNDRPFWTLPVTVAADDPQDLALWIAPGSPLQRPEVLRVGVPALAEGSWEAIDTTWVGEGVLMLRRHGRRRHALWLFWHPSGAFRGWYVNLEEWWQTAEGVEAFDHQLDIWVYPDGRWEWKDEDDLAESVDLGIHTAEEAAAIRAEGEAVIAHWPFPTGWEEWRPDPAWPVPELPPRDDV